MGDTDASARRAIQHIAKLKKICDRLDIPYPPLGYWAKLCAGKSVTPPPLPAPQSDTPTIIAMLAIAGPILEKRRLEAEEAECRRWDEERRRREVRERQDQDRNRWRRFVEFPRLWEEARLAGDFLDAMEKQSLDPEAKYGGRSAAEWITAWEYPDRH